MEQRWEFVLPWCEVLHTRIKYAWVGPAWEVWTDRKYRLEVNLPKRCQFITDSIDEEYLEQSFRDKCRQVREALALLAAVAHVDHAAWKYLLKEHCGVKLGQEGSPKCERDVPAEYYLVLDHDQDSRSEYFDSLELDLDLFCGTDHQTCPSADYVAALAQIAVLDTSFQANNKSGVEIVVPVYPLYSCHTFSSDGGPTLVENVWRSENTISEMWKSLDPKDVPTEYLRCTFALQPLVARVEWIMSWPEMAAQLGELMARSLCLSEISLIARTDPGRVGSESAAKKLLRHLMACLFGNTGRYRELTCFTASPRRSLQNQLDWLLLTCDLRLLRGDLHAMASAMVVNQTTRNLVMHLFFSIPPYHDFNAVDEISTQEWWQWIAYTFFSKRARACSSLQSLALLNIRSMHKEDIDGAFADILNSEHPEEELFQCSRGLVRERDATLEADAPIRWEIDDRGEPTVGSNDLTFSSPTPSIRTFSDDGNSEWVNVMVPGFGRCQVQRCALNFTESTVHEANVFSLTSLTLSFQKWTSPPSNGLPDFLSSVGSALRSLTIDGAGLMELNEISILQICPKLEMLALCGGLVDVQFDFRDFHPRTELSQSQTIRWHNVADLSCDLSDSNNPIVNCIRRLRVHLHKSSRGWAQVWEDYETPDFAADVNALVSMLDANQTIDYIEIIVGERHRQYLASFKRHHLTPLQRWVEVSAENKIAFLSVLSAKRVIRSEMAQSTSVGVPSSGSRIDELVVSQIFAFAKPSVLREVHVRWEDYDDDG